MKARRGNTLVEVVVAMLLSAVMITAVFTVALSNKEGGIKSDAREAGGSSTQSIVKLLANYVTADPTNNYIAGPTYCSAVARCGPGLASWSLNGFNYTDSQGAVWALAPGVHTITNTANNPAGLLPGLTGPPYNGSVSYNVTWPAGCVVSYPLPAACTTPTISVNVNWTTP